MLPACRHCIKHPITLDVEIISCFNDFLYSFKVDIERDAGRWPQVAQIMGITPFRPFDFVECLVGEIYERVIKCISSMRL